MKNYLDSTTNELQTPQLITMRGLPLDEEFLRKIGIYPVEYPYPEHAVETHALEPDGDPVLNAGGTAYVQGFKVVELPLSDAKRNVKRKITSQRWQVETGGITLPDGTHLLTTREDQAVITSAVTRAMLKPEVAVDYKMASGAWATVDAATMTTMGLAVSAHVEACFSRERALHELVDAAESIADLQSLAINADWPECANTLTPDEGQSPKNLVTNY